MKIRTLCFVLPAVLACVFAAQDAHAAPRIDVVIRFDDYCSGMATDSVLRFFLLFENRSIPITFAVIPFEGSFSPAPGQPDPKPLTEEKAWILKRMLSMGNFEVAQHGFSHEDNAKGTPRHSSEFAGLPLEEQMQRIARGKELLESRLGMKVNSFAPPWNTYDENTVLALKTGGFSVFSPGGPDPFLQDKYAMPIIGCGAGVGTLRTRIEEARNGTDPHPIMTGIFHIYEIKDFDPKGTFTLAELAETLDWLKAQPDVDLCTVQDAATKLIQRNVVPPTADAAPSHP